MNSTNRFRTIIPNATPWRDRASDDSLVEALVMQGATDAEAIDVLAADRERMRAEVARLLLFQPPPSIVLEGVTAENAAVRAAVLAEREACAKLAREEADRQRREDDESAAFACETVAATILARM